MVKSMYVKFHFISSPFCVFLIFNLALIYYFELSAIATQSYKVVLFDILNSIIPLTNNTQLTDVAQRSKQRREKVILLKRQREDN